MKEKVSVTGVPETMIQTLYARAKESQKDNPMIQDDMAAEIVSKLDYDFSNADKDKAMSYGVIARTIVLDEMVGRHLSKNPNTVVINIASGMDSDICPFAFISKHLFFCRYQTDNICHNMVLSLQYRFLFHDIQDDGKSCCPPPEE